MEPQHKVKVTKSRQNGDNQNAPPGGIQPTAKQLITKPRNMVTLMCRLAAHTCPPGGFWARTQNFRETASEWKGKLMHSNKHHITNRTQSKNIISSSPNLEFLARPRILDVSPIQKASLTLSCASTMFSSHSTLLQSVSLFWNPSIRPLHPLWYSLPLPLACSLSLSYYPN